MTILEDQYLIVDVEATCSDDGAVPKHEMEIIEIGALMQDAITYEIVSEFQSFIRPVRHRRLTDFCVELTTITQDQVDPAPLFPEVIAELQEWMAAFGNAVFSSWGAYDKGQFEQDCRFHKIAYPFGERHINIKTEFSRYLGTSKRYGMAGALRRLGLKLEGTHHRGIDDVRNIARIVRAMGTNGER